MNLDAPRSTSKRLTQVDVLAAILNGDKSYTLAENCRLPNGRVLKTGDKITFEGVMRQGTTATTYTETGKSPEFIGYAAVNREALRPDFNVTLFSVVEEPEDF